MITARLKAIFFTLLCSELMSLTLAFILSIFFIYAPGLGDEIVSQLVFVLLPIYIIDMLGILISFRWKISSLENKVNMESRTFLLRSISIVFFVSLVFLIRSYVVGSSETSYLIVGFTLATLTLLISSHYLVAAYLTKKNSIDVNKIKVLVLGMNARSKSFCNILTGSPLLGIDIIGYVDTAENESSNITYLGSLENIDDILKKEVVDEIFIFLPIRSFYDSIHNVIKLAGLYGITTNMLGNMFEAGPARQPNICLSDFHTSAYTSTMRDQLALLVKRLIDVVCSSIALILLAPLFVIVAIYIKAVSPGSAFFVQQRAGYNKRVFNMYKFRTMVPNAEKMLEDLMQFNEMDGAAFKMKNDPRLIPGARFLRKFSIDELPQLLNVLFGDMSVVGPRPLSLRDYNYLSDDWQRKRFSVKPGLTCIWQVSGRNDVSFDEWMSMDIEYIETWTLGLDFIIMMKTVFEVLKGGGR